MSFFKHKNNIVSYYSTCFMQWRFHALNIIRVYVCTLYIYEMYEKSHGTKNNLSIIPWIQFTEKRILNLAIFLLRYIDYVFLFYFFYFSSQKRLLKSQRSLIEFDFLLLLPPQLYSQIANQIHKMLLTYWEDFLAHFLWNTLSTQKETESWWKCRILLSELADLQRFWISSWYFYVNIFLAYAKCQELYISRGNLNCHGNQGEKLFQVLFHLTSSELHKIFVVRF